MKQLMQRLDTGSTSIMDVPVPSAHGVNLLVETRKTVISAGTERMLVEFGRSSLLSKARSQPDKVKQVLDKVRAEGLSTTVEAVRAKLEVPIPLGYCHAGVVVEVGEEVRKFRVGDRVVTNGNHAEYARIPETLAARIPDGVDFDAAAFTPLAAIGLQGIRLAAPTLGETVVVFGLGLIGLLTVQLLRANGCRVIGIDHNPTRLQLAEQFGAVAIDGTQGDVVARVTALTGGIGADAVLLTLSSKSNDPMRQAAAMSRKRGRLVLVGVTGLELVRDDFYKKELSFSVSCSYGPGRYDPTYEDQARDYPVAYVRWSEQRNFEAVLALMTTGHVDPHPLISHEFDFIEAASAYELIAGGASSLGIMLSYPGSKAAAPRSERHTVETRPMPAVSSSGNVAVIGAGNFAVRTLIPLLKSEGANLHTIASNSGLTSAIAGNKFGFGRITANVDQLLGDPTVDTVFILTRHESHARLAIRAMNAGKNVFVEKPLALTEDELDEVAGVAASTARLLTVGFNRRFSPYTQELARLLLGRSGPLSIVITVNAGAITRDHWTQDPHIGGGRVIGEGSHFIDLARFLAKSPIASLQVTVARDSDQLAIDDIVHITLSFADGSTAVINYLSNGARDFPKEQIECFFDGKTVTIDNWRRLRRFGVRRPFFQFAGSVDKGHRVEIRTWMKAVRDGGPHPIPLQEMIEVSRWAIRAGLQARHGDRSLASSRPSQNDQSND